MDKLTNEMARRAIREGVPFLMTGPGGEIYEANEAFCKLVKYTEPDLQRMGTVVISIESDDHEEMLAEEVLHQKLLTGEIQNYNTWKSYRDRFGSAIPGQIQVNRHPPGIEKVEYCLCWFTPLLNGSKAALDLVMKYLETHSRTAKADSETIQRMAAAINTVAPRTKFRAMADSMLDWAADNPKFALAILAFVITFSPRGIVENWATKQGWLPAQPVQIQIKDEKTGQVKPADEIQLQQLEMEYATKIANHQVTAGDEEAQQAVGVFPHSIEVITPGGTKVSWNESSASSSSRTMRGGTSWSRYSGGGIRRGTGGSAARNEATVGLPGEPGDTVETSF